MDYKIIGKTVPVVEMKLGKGETVYTQSGGMTYQSEGIDMATNTHGGIMKGIGRMFAGESMFMANYTAKRDEAVIAFAALLFSLFLSEADLPQGLTIQKGAFLCAENAVETKVAFTKKFSAGLFGGEGFILQQASGNGMLFLEVDGDAIEKELEPGEVLKVDTGNVVAFDSNVKYEIETVKGLGNIFLGGEGLFLTKLIGPGKVILQSQNFGDFASRVMRLIPSRK